jgi:DNA-directed RNA polymerase specialized sigma24 family protein
MLSEKEIIQLLQSEKLSARWRGQEAILQQYTRRVVQHLKAHLPYNKVEEAANDALRICIEILEQKDFRLQKNIEAFLIGIANNLIKEGLKAKTRDLRKQEAAQQFHQYFHKEITAESSNDQQHIKAFMKAIESIAENSKTDLHCYDLLSLRYLEGLDILEIANWKKKSEGAIKMQLKRCKERFKKQLQLFLNG